VRQPHRVVAAAASASDRSLRIPLLHVVGMTTLRRCPTTKCRQSKTQKMIVYSVSCPEQVELMSSNGDSYCLFLVTGETLAA
jgi:hypothetical protein